MNKAALLSTTAERYSPLELVDTARASLGGIIDLDPASCAQADRVVRATNIFTKESDGLAHEWHGTVFLNPPGSRKGLVIEGIRHHEPAVWWTKLVQEVEAGRVTAAVFVVFNLETLRHCGKYAGRHPADGTMVWLRERTCFLDEGLRSLDSPAHGTAVALLGAASVEPWRRMGRVTPR